MAHCSFRYVRRAVYVLVAGIALALGSRWTYAADAAASTVLQAVQDPISGQIDILEGKRLVLRYNYRAVQPPQGFLDRVQPDNRKYAPPRSDYIHPLFGLDGDVLTADWSKDHPHHRGIYWAWPEVDYRGQRGDLHALQNVIARPTGRIELHSTEAWSEIEAENVWKWQDQTPIVLETATIRVWRSNDHGQFIDLMLNFQAMDNDVALARRGTLHYGGLNLRLSPVKDLKILTHTDPADAKNRSSWGYAGGIWGDKGRMAFLAVFQHPNNPEYPGQWIEYPGLPWFQPTFPEATTRYVLKKGQPLKLQYRLWLQRGNKQPDEIVQKQCQTYQQTNSDSAGSTTIAVPPSH